MLACGFFGNGVAVGHRNREGPAARAEHIARKRAWELFMGTERNEARYKHNQQQTVSDGEASSLSRHERMIMGGWSGVSRAESE